MKSFLTFLLLFCVAVGYSQTTIKASRMHPVRLIGGETVWKDIEGEFNSGQSGGSAYPAFTVDSSYATFTIDTTAPTICKQYYVIQMNHDAKLGAVCFPHVHYKYTTAQGAPTFIVKYRWVNIGSVAGRFTWIKLNQTTGPVNNCTELAYSLTGIPMSGNGLSSILEAQVYLFSTTGSTKTCFGKSFDIHFEIDSMGSNSELSKDDN